MASPWTSNSLAYSRKIGIFELCVWPGDQYEGSEYRAWIRIPSAGDFEGLPTFNATSVKDAKRNIEAAFRNLIDSVVGAM